MVTPSETTTWPATLIDDNLAVAERFVPILNKIGVEIVDTSLPLDYVSNGHGKRIPVVDLNLSDSEGGPRDGIALAQAILRTDPDQPILFLSRFFGEERFRNLERRLSPTARTFRLDKIDLERQNRLVNNRKGNQVDRDRARRAFENLKEQVAALMNGNFTRSPIERPDTSEFSALSLASVGELSLRSQVDIHSRIGAVLRPYIDSLFDSRPEIEWILFDVPQCSVVEWGTERIAMTRSEIVAKASQMDPPAALPVVFSRPRAMNLW